MNEFVTKMHTESGLINEIPNGISVSDADPFGANSMMRLSVTLVTGDSFRVRAPGRFGDHAKELAAVWKDISSAAKPQTIAQLKCVQCDRDLQKRFNYCPYCGVQQAPMDIIDGEDEV